MTNSGKKRMQDAARDIDDGLGTLFETLGAAINEMITRIEDGQSGTVSRDQVFDTAKGPIRAHAGIKLRMGGLDQGDTAMTPQPVNARRSQPAPQSPQVKPIAYDLLEDDDDWILTADIPGVSAEHLDISKDGTVLLLRTNGPRRYQAQIDLNTNFSLADDGPNLRNGILTLRIKKKATT
ncbi:MAG: hypothetical protein AAF801_00520 [Pseudomonadota bacterium]